PGAGNVRGRGGSLVSRMLDFLGRSLEPVYGFSSLLAFKRKFQPEFQPLFMAYPDPVALPAIGIALARAYLPSQSMREVLAFARGLG
ncbi:MAG: phosphatidylglycerol lysyltransferase domain-containing protein, partial [Cryobacterium sp.]